MDSLFNMDRLSEIITAYAPKVAGALIVLILGFIVIGWITRIARNAMKKRDVDVSLRPFLASLISVGLKILLILSVAGMFGVETASFIAVFGALAFAIGMALQGTLGHFASGVLILLFKPFRVDDLVEIGGGKTGVVEQIQIFNTVLSTLDNKRVIVPNGLVTSNVITNISGQGTIGVELAYGISYDADIDQARQIILDAGKACEWVLDDPAQGVVVGELGDSAVVLNTRPFCKSEHYWDTYFFMQERVKKDLDKAGVSIPYPQIDVHVNQV